MAHAVTHIILTIVLIDVFRDYFMKKKFPTYIVLIGGIAGLIPDIDIVFSWIYNLINNTNVSFHGGITHSILFPIIFFAIGLVLYFEKTNIKNHTKIKKQKYRNWYIIAFVIAFGWFFHLFLDCMFGGYSMLLFPFYAVNFCPELGLFTQASAIDAIILVIWLVHEEVRHKIKDYI